MSDDDDLLDFGSTILENTYNIFSIDDIFGNVVVTFA